MPEEDYDIEALLGRISALEKKLAEGVVVQNVGGMAVTNTPAPVVVTERAKPVAVEASKQEEPVEEYADFDVPPDMDVPPDEAEMGGWVYMDAPIVEAPTPKPVEKKQPQAEKRAQTI